MATSTKWPLPSLLDHHGFLAVFVVGVAVGDVQVKVAVVVEVLKDSAPARVLAAHDGEPGGVRGVLEEVASVHVQAAVSHVGNEQVELAVAVNVAKGRAHRRDALAALAKGQAQQQRIVDERAVALVDQVVVLHGVVGHEDVEPASVEEVGGGRAHAPAFGDEGAGLPR